MILIKLLLCLTTLAQANPDTARPSLVGHWQFYKKIYQGQEIPEGPNATLRLHFDFSKDGMSRLYWWHEGENDHCYREGKYSLEGNVLVDEITWVDPANTIGCSDDPDMQLGRKTRSPIVFRDGDFLLRFYIGEEPLDFVWKKLIVEEE